MLNLMKCHGCGHWIPGVAKTCPDCKRVNPHHPNIDPVKAGDIIGGLVLLLVLVGVAWNYWPPPGRDTQAEFSAALARTQARQKYAQATVAPAPATLFRYNLVYFEDVSYAKVRRVSIGAMIHCSAVPSAGQLLKQATEITSKEAPDYDKTAVRIFLPGMDHNKTAPYFVANFTEGRLTDSSTVGDILEQFKPE